MLRIEEHPGGVRRFRMRRTMAGRSLHEVSAWWIPPGILVDTGPPPTAAELVDALRATPPLAVLLTHHHEDHVGGARALREAFELEPLAGRETVALVARRRRIPFYRAMVWGHPEPFVARALEADSLVVAGLAVEAHATPGHAFDHLAYWLPERGELLSGDLYVHPRVVYMRRIEDPWLHLDSLRRLLALDPPTLLCAHAGRITPGGAAIARKIAAWEELGARVRELGDRGLSATAIRRQLLGREGVMALLTFGDFSKRNLVRKLLAGP